MENLENYLSSREKLSQIFEKRKNYEQYTENIFDSLNTKTIDANKTNGISERLHYGHVNRTGQAILSNSEKIIKEQKFGKTYYGYDFVLDAFFELKNYFDPVSKNFNWGLVLSPISLETKQDPIITYGETFIKNIYDFVNQTIKDTHPDSYSITFEKYKQIFLKSVPNNNFSYERFISSKTFGPQLTNLTIILSKNDIKNDQLKIKDFWETAQYKFLIESARRFGFLVDSFAPWRLTVDLNSMATSYFIRRRKDLDALKRNNFQSAQLLEEFIQKYSPKSPTYMNVEKIHLDNIFDEYFLDAKALFDKNKNCIIETGFNYFLQSQKQ